MIPKDLGVSSAKDLDGATVCIQTGTTTELNLADFFRANNISYEPVPIETGAEAVQQYAAGACDVYTTDASALAAQRANFEDPSAHVIMPEIISKEPLGPLVRHGDNEWADIVRWTLNALITAEELGVTSQNLEELSAGTSNPEINRLLGSEGELGAMLGLDAEWAKRAIGVAGNYGEVFEKNIGESTPIGLARGLNAQWTDGGLILLAAVPVRQKEKGADTPRPSHFRPRGGLDGETGAPHRKRVQTISAQSTGNVTHDDTCRPADFGSGRVVQAFDAIERHPLQIIHIPVHCAGRHHRLHGLCGRQPGAQPGRGGVEHLVQLPGRTGGIRHQPAPD